MDLRTIAASICVCGVMTVAAQEAPDRATVLLRDGTRVEGRIEALGKGFLYLRPTETSQRKIPVGDIALIDRKGAAAGLPETELREARGADHLLLLVGGSSYKGQLVGIQGGEGSGDNFPRTYVFRTSDGQEHRYGPADVARIYLGSYPFAAGRGAFRGGMTPAAPTTSAPIPPGAVRVLGTADWVATGVSVRRGDRVSFVVTGDVQLSDNPADRAKPAGSTRLARNAPLPAVAAGALIGRIGPMGRPFGIGDQGNVPMPEDGMLFLAVNDDERTDNSGEFDVVLTLDRRR